MQVAARWVQLKTRGLAAATRGPLKPGVLVSMICWVRNQAIRFPYGDFRDGTISSTNHLISTMVRLAARADGSFLT